MVPRLLLRVGAYGSFPTFGAREVYAQEFLLEMPHYGIRGIHHTFPIQNQQG